MSLHHAFIIYVPFAERPKTGKSIRGVIRAGNCSAGSSAARNSSPRSMRSAWRMRRVRLICNARSQFFRMRAKATTEGTLRACLWAARAEWGCLHGQPADAVTGSLIRARRRTPAKRWWGSGERPSSHDQHGIRWCHALCRWITAATGLSGSFSLLLRWRQGATASKESNP